MKIVELLEDPSYDIGSLRSALSVRQGQSKKSGSEKELPFAVVKDIARDLGFSITDVDTLKLFRDKIDPTGDVFDISNNGGVLLKNPEKLKAMAKSGGPSVDAMASSNAKTLSPAHGSKI